MRSRRWINLALVVLIGIMVLTTYLSGQRDTPEPVLRVSPIQPEQVQRFEFSAPGGEAIVAARRDGQWFVESPLAMPANNHRAAELLGMMRARSLSGFRAAGNDLSQYGLAPPMALLRVEGLTFAFGGTEPLNGRRYVEFDGQVHLVEDHYFGFLPPAASHLVHLAPFVELNRITRLSLPDRQLHWNGSRWEVEGFDIEGADRLNQFADQWLRVQAVAVRPLSTTSKGGQNGARRAFDYQLVAEDADAGVEVRFDVTHGEYEIRFARPDVGLQYHLLKRTLNPLLSPAAPDAQ